MTSNPTASSSKAALEVPAQVPEEVSKGPIE